MMKQQLTARHLEGQIGRFSGNIAHVYSLASADDIEDGKHWYKDANKLAQLGSVYYGLTLAQSAGLLAVFSIDCTWDKTIADYHYFLSHNGEQFTGRYGMVFNKALAIYRDRASIEDVLKGDKARKIYCFWQNILNPADDTRVTIDRHAVRIAYDPYSDRPVERKLYNSLAKYRVWETAYRDANKAINAGLLPHQLQAITWVTFQRIFTKNNGHSVNS